MRLRQLTFVLAAVAAACASPSPAAAPAPAADPGRWRFDEEVAGGGTRQARRIASPAADAVNVLSTTTTPAPRVTKKLVTLAPGGNSIQDILFNNGYRETPADAEPEPNNIDNDANLDGLDQRDVWLLDGNLLVLKGGAFSDSFSDTEPLDDFQAPYRRPKFPPPEFLGEDELPPGLLAAWRYGFGDPSEGLPPPGPEGTVGYSPYGRPESRPEPESVAGPHSNVGAPPYAGGEPYTADRPYTDAQPYGEVPPSYGDRKTYTSDGQPYVDSPPYAEIHPYTAGQPYDKASYEGDKPPEDGSQPINPELMKGYSPLGRPEPRPDSLYQTPKIEISPESQIRVQPESGPEPEPFRPYNGQSYGERRQSDGGDSRRRGGRVRFPGEAPSVDPQRPRSVPVRPGTRSHTYSVSTSYSSTSSQSSTSVRGHNARYLPPPRAERLVSSR